jgi:hypothetical protein
MTYLCSTSVIGRVKASDFIFGICSYPPLATKRHEGDMVFIKLFNNSESDRNALKLEQLISQNMSQTIGLEVR